MTLTLKPLSDLPTAATHWRCDTPPMPRKPAEWRTDERQAVLVREYAAGTKRRAILALINNLPGAPVTSLDAICGWAKDLGTRRPVYLRRSPVVEPPPGKKYSGWFFVPACFRPDARTED